MTENFNPFVFQGEQIVDNEEIPTTIAGTSNLLNAMSGNPQAIYTQEEYDKLWAQYQYWKNHSKQTQDNLLALADILYQSLAFINAGRLYANKAPIMMNDIAKICENNAILTEITADLRKAAIASGYGIISELEQSQNHLRTEVMQKWQARFHSEERDTLSRTLLEEPTTHNAAPAEDEIFS